MERGLERPKHYKYRHLQEHLEREFDLEQMGQDGCHLWGDDSQHFRLASTIRARIYTDIQEQGLTYQ
jgi:hypothetical protein